MAAVSVHALEPIRLAVALSHCLPECSVELSGDAGERMVVGFGDDATMSPCGACAAVAAAMRTSPDELGPLVGLPPGCPRARLLDEDIDQAHVGLGVYRYSDDSVWGYVFATVLSPGEVRSLVEARSAERLVDGRVEQQWLVRAGEWRLTFDDGIAVTVCSSRYAIGASGLLPQAESLALDVVAACLACELSSSHGE